MCSLVAATRVGTAFDSMPLQSHAALEMRYRSRRRNPTPSQRVRYAKNPGRDGPRRPQRVEFWEDGVRFVAERDDDYGTFNLSSSLWPGVDARDLHFIGYVPWDGRAPRLGAFQSKLDSYGEPVNKDGHPVTARTLRWAAMLLRDARPAKQYYMRLGDIPHTGRSGHLNLDITEGGVSVLKAAQDPITGLWRALPTHGGKSERDYRRMLPSIDGKARPMYLVRGVWVGTGTDGEPLLRGARIVRRLVADITPEAANYYVRVPEFASYREA